MNQKLFLFGAIVLILVGAGSYILGTKKSQSVQTNSLSISPTVVTSNDTSPSTANWKIYTDTTLLASFKYPPNWSLNPGRYGISTPTIKDNWYIYLSDPDYGNSDCRGDCPVFSITVSVKNNDQNLDVVNYIKKDFNSITGGLDDFSRVKMENVTLTNGLSFTKVTDGFPGSDFYSLYTLHNKKIYTISVGAGANGMRDDINNPKVKQDLVIFDQILSTFRFSN